MKSLAVSLLRLLIGIGFTFSLALGVTLTMLTLCDGSGNNLTLSRTGLHWEWSGAAAVSWLVTALCWLGWRRLPAAKPTRAFPTLERWLQTPIFLILWATLNIFLVLDMVLRLASHPPGASWPQLGTRALMALPSCLWAVGAWKQWKRKASVKAFSKEWYSRR